MEELIAQAQETVTAMFMQRLIEDSGLGFDAATTNPPLTLTSDEQAIIDDILPEVVEMVVNTLLVEV